MNRRTFIQVAAEILLSLWLSACQVLERFSMARRETDTLRHLVILYTNDEHGWMEGYQNTNGARGMMRLWRARENLGENDHLLVLSGGDMWTGPALSTVLEGQPMADVMNQLGYRAAALGNHDFDFGQDAIRARLAESAFPFLSANIRLAATGEIPDYAEPYQVFEVNGVKVGVIGVTTTETRVDTKPAFVADLDFMEYRDVLPTFAAKAREDGAQLLIVLAHVCASETRQLAAVAAEHGISIIGGGHCHQEIDEVVDGVHLVESGYFMRAYVRIELLFDTETSQVVELQTALIRNDHRAVDDQIEATIEDWRGRTDPALWQPIGYLAGSLDRKSPEMAHLLVEPWLTAWPQAQVGLAETRYVQQDLYPGALSEASLVDTLSTTNQLVEIGLSGQELVELVESHQPLVAGLRNSGGYQLANKQPIDPAARYRVLVPDTLYAGGFYYDLASLDPEPVYTGVDWRDPAISWIRSLNTSPGDPIDPYLAGTT